MTGNVIKKIDMHCHTTDKLVKFAASPDASLDAITHAMEKHGIVKTVLLATYFPHKGTGISNYRLYSWIRDRQEFVLFGSLDFEHYYTQGCNELEEMAEQGFIKGVKIYTGYQQVDFFSQQFKQIAKLAEKYALPLMFHGGVSYIAWRELGRQGALDLVKYLKTEGQKLLKTPKDFEMIAKEFPAIPIIVSHLCKPFFEEMIDVLNRNHNIYTDMSGLLDSKQDQDYREQCVADVKRVIDECGPEKLLFGTDFPVQTHDDSIYFVEHAMQDYSVEEKKKVYFDNASALIGVTA